MAIPTTDEREELSDRDLDALVVEKVTLWTPITNEDGWQSPNGQVKHWPGPPEYSVNIKDAMEVVEKMRGHRFQVFMNNEQRGIWRVWFGSRRAVRDSDVYFCESLARAICLAALAVIGER